VAKLAAVGVAWYTRLEQGRDVRPSPEVMAAIAQALRLTAVERAHIFGLTGLSSPMKSGSSTPTAQHLAILRALDPVPAYIYDAHFDYVAANVSFERMSTWLLDVFGAERNLLWQLFGNRAARDVLGNWEAVAECAVAWFRQCAGPAVENSVTVELVSRLSSISREFSALWTRCQVNTADALAVTVKHPTVGNILLDATQAELVGSSGLRLCMLTPASGSDAAERLQALG
jgi:transcriptional regulator with XRE-family HTH domain